jgi:hypothetical protein
MNEMLTIPFGPLDKKVSFQVEDSEFYRKWWEDWGSTDLENIYKTFGITVFRRSTALLGLDAFCKRNNFKGRRCIEIGTCKGLTAIVLARHFDEVVTIDTYPDDDKFKFAKHCGITNIRFIDAKNNAEKAQVVDGLEFDAAYCDGNHADDAETDFKLVKRCGRILFHEWWPLQPAVWGLVNSLHRYGAVVTHGDCFAYWTEHGQSN